MIAIHAEPQSTHPLAFLIARTSWAKSGFAIADQGIVSGTNLLITIFLARWLSAEAFGAFAVGFTCFLFLSGFHNELLMEPMSVLGPTQYATRLPSYFRTHLRIHSLLTGTMSAILLVSALLVSFTLHDAQMGRTLAGTAVVLPFLLLFWLTRRMTYVLQRPRMACYASTLYSAVGISAVAFLGHVRMVGPVVVLMVMAVSSLASSLYLLVSAGVLSSTIPDPLAIRLIWQQNWTYGKWLTAGSVVYSIATYAQMFAIAGVSSVAAAGTLRALQLPSLVMTQATTAISLLAVSNLSYDFGRGDVQRVRSKGQTITIVLTVVAIAYDLLLVLSSRLLANALYGGKYNAQAWLIPALGLMPVLSAVATGLSVTLRALHLTKVDFMANAMAAPISVLSAVVLVRVWGIPGAVASALVAATVLAGSTTYFYVRTARQADGLAPAF
jgi:O-antigen/teichoic acid export membrane protein